MTTARSIAGTVDRERIAAATKHWVGVGTACNNRCVFCLNGDAGRTFLVPDGAIREELKRGRETGAERVVISGGEASVHPAFVDMIRCAKALGYSWVQTVTNGVRYADGAFFRSCVEAGLDEITFSIHGHTPQLHDRLTGHPGAFRAIVTAIGRAVRTDGLVVSADIVLCAENIGVLDRIVELGIHLGVREFDLLQVVPHGRAWQNRKQLLYEPAEHLEALHRVLRLARHPELTIWTNRLPARYLEGFEDLIQDPHKLYDEVRGRETEFRAWIEGGVALPCREPERCLRCFLQEFCAYAGDRIERSGEASPSCAAPPLLQSAGELDAAFAGEGWSSDGPLEIDLTATTAAWMMEHREALEHRIGRLAVRQRGPERLAGAPLPVDPRRFFPALGLPLRVGGLPRCMIRPAVPAETVTDTSPVASPDRLVADFIRNGYFVKSLRCAGCEWSDSCSGLQINLARIFGLSALTPIRESH